jgi:hypothetical protein
VEDNSFPTTSSEDALGTSIGGITGPVVFGQLIEAGSRGNIFVAYVIAALFMIGAAIVEVTLGVRAEGKSLESVAMPLTAIEKATGATA